MDIAGTEGVIEWSSDDAETVQTHLTHTEAVEADEVAVPGAKAADSPFTTQLRHFYECIENNSAPIVTAHDALMALEIGLAAIESAKTGRPVTLNTGDK
jgi:predicted dehydrogenase